LCRRLLHKGPVFRFCPGEGHDLLLREGSMPHGRDALAARFTRAWSANADAPGIAIHLKSWREHGRIYSATFSRGRSVFFIGAAICSASPGNGRCNAFASSQGARIHTSRSSLVVRITGMALG